MLDECKGEKFEEVLSSFSTIVLRRKIQSESIGAGSVVRDLALGHSIPASQQESMLPLAIAHRASLAAQLRKKKELRSHYSSFGRLLDLKELELADRARKARVGSQSQTEGKVPQKAIEECKEQLKNHWLGDTKWLDTIVHGNPQSRDDPLLDTPFNKVWSNVQNGTIASVGATSGRTLLADLEIRVAGQQARLRRWKKLQEDMRKSAASRATPLKADLSPKQEKTLGLEFRRHQELMPKHSHTQDAPPTQEGGRTLPMTAITTEYQKLIASMREELANVDKPKTRNGTSWSRGSEKGILASKASVFGEESSTLSELTSGRDSPRSEDHLLLDAKSSTSVLSKIPTRTRSVQHHRTGVNELDSLDTPPGIDDVSPRPELLSLPSLVTSSARLEEQSTAVSEAVSSVPVPVLEPSPTQHSDDQPSPQKDEDDLLAEQILASVANAEPSPVKPKLSLAERTRRSMAHMHNKDSPSMALPPIPRPVPLPPMPESPTLPSPDFESFDTRASLLERTRQSMSLLPTKPRKSMHKPRHSKMFPTNQFETPKKQHPGVTNDVKSLTPPEELFSHEADYASVFKSRPKIGLSPTLSPSRLQEASNEVEDMELGGHWDSSPVVRAAGGIARI